MHQNYCVTSLLLEKIRRGSSGTISFSLNVQSKHKTLGFHTELAAMEPQDCVASHDIPVAILQEKILSARSPEDKARSEKELDELIKAREIETLCAKLWKSFNWHDPKYQTALQHAYVFANLIKKKVPVERIEAGIHEVSIKPKKERVEGTASPSTLRMNEINSKH
ncbi:hypothetical protein AOLI_G00206690 [Acnodon oligacanthus]